MSRKIQSYFALLIGIVLITGLFLPHGKKHFINSDMTQEYYITEYGWELTPVVLIFVFCGIITGISFSSRIAMRLLIIRILLALFIPVVFTAIIIDSSYLADGPYATQLQTGCYLTYFGALLTMIFGILHFRTSYSKYKKMLDEELKKEQDLIDSF